jgi:hypothetical protein
LAFLLLRPFFTLIPIAALIFSSKESHSKVVFAAT